VTVDAGGRGEHVWGMRSVLIGLAVALVALASCDDPAPSTAQDEPSNALGLPTPERFATEHTDFAGYWHQGVAELSRYRLRQARYGETHDGEAVLVFVTEPFLPGAQVKHEHGEHPDAIEVLKLNAHRRFYTGIYPYSVLTSSFSPTSGDPTLKVSTSVQEWCGHAYTQLNRRDGQLQLTQHSYFQDEADEERAFDEAPFEDAVMTTLRRDPSAAPTGELSMVPALHHLRFVHRPVRAYRAEASRSTVDDDRFGGRVGRYRLEYPELDRTVEIFYGLAHPHVIHGWVEDGAAGRTEAVRTDAILTDYWSHHGSDDGAYREALGLTM